MWDINNIKSYLEENLISKRYEHTLGVVSVAVKLSKIYGVNKDKAEVAALLHDIAKNTKVSEMKDIIDKNHINLTVYEEDTMELWHAIVGPILSKNIFNIQDEEILDSIRWHTTGRENMRKLEKIIYLADMIEPSRSFKGIEELRKMAEVDLDKAMEMALTQSIEYLLDKKAIIDINTINARNYLIYNKKN